MATQLMTKQTPLEIRQAAFHSLEQSRQLLNKHYLATLGDCPVQLFTGADDEKINSDTDVRIFKVERIVLENKQSVLESLTAAYTALGSAGYSVFLLLKGERDHTDVYLGVKAQPKSSFGEIAGDLLSQAFKGHFLGSHLSPIKGDKVSSLLYNLRTTGNQQIPASITSVTGVPSLSVEEREHFMQGLEHFIDAAEGQNYQALILAEPVSSLQLNFIQRGYEGIATQLSPLLKQSLSYGENESESVGLSIGENLSQSLGKNLSLTETKGINESSTHTVTQGTNESYSQSNSYSRSQATAATKGLGIISGIAGGAMGVAFGPVGAMATNLVLNSLSTAVSANESKGTSETFTKGTSHSTSEGKTIGTQSSSAQTEGSSVSHTYGTNQNRSVNNTLGSSRQITLEHLDKSIEQLLKRVDHQLERVEEAQRYGGWKTAAYFISDSSASSRSLASIFLGLMRGNHSNSEDFSLTTWKNNPQQVLSWLANLSHPRLMSPLARELNIDYLTPATLVSGKEMAIQLSLPRRSTSTVSVVEAQAFGRRIQNVNGEEKAEKSIYLGEIRHLWQKTQQKVNLDLQKLASHVFVSGSTGSGKSNTVYQILSELRKNEVKFMVIEPAKGEYKNVFGHFSDVNVFGTNPTQATLLKINPFKFPQGVHVLEHIDRLIEIFNVCWPMYAAMPAILKEAMLEAYKTSGWNLEDSYNRYSDQIFPSFADLLTQLEQVIAKSAYAEEMKSNYIGSLVTRVKSLTNGLNGQIFSSAEIESRILFDQNVIVDLSRVGSQETKSLIMGILVMRLSEYRMSSNQMNQPLKHVTVLEEAHNILKRTSTEQSSEGANVAGKAVEMLSNAIAEMRTYGEGFIIADQSPNAVDISAIRNTNTKIIMRLPDEADRRLAGKSSGATDEQIEEIAKLPKGVAVVYQNDWLEPILCQIKRFETDEKPYIYVPQPHISEERKRFNLHLARLLLRNKIEYPETIDLDCLKQGLHQFDLATKDRIGLFNTLVEMEQTGQASIWTNGKDVVNLLLSMIGVKEQIIQVIEHQQFENVKRAVELGLQEQFNLSENLTQGVCEHLRTIWEQHHTTRGVA